MKLTENFTLDELIHTDCGLLNVPNTEQISNLKQLSVNVLQPLRNIYGDTIDVNSGFRSFEVNKKANKGKVKPSQHCKGEAADLDSKNNALLFRIIRDNLVFDQLIWEKGNELQPDWVHVSYKTQGNRCEILVFDGKGYKRV
jgi:hypothetical protein